MSVVAATDKPQQTNPIVPKATNSMSQQPPTLPYNPVKNQTPRRLTPQQEMQQAFDFENAITEENNTDGTQTGGNSSPSNNKIIKKRSLDVKGLLAKINDSKYLYPILNLFCLTIIVVIIMFAMKGSLMIKGLVIIIYLALAAFTVYTYKQV